MCIRDRYVYGPQPPSAPTQICAPQLEYVTNASNGGTSDGTTTVCVAVLPHGSFTIIVYVPAGRLQKIVESNVGPTVSISNGLHRL